MNTWDGRRQTAQSDIVCHAQMKETAAKGASEKSLYTAEKNKKIACREHVVKRHKYRVSQICILSVEKT